MLDHCPTTNEITSALQKLNIKPKVILTDNGGQFKEQWKLWCKTQGIEAKSAHAYYPQDKGKVERTNKNITEELINIIFKFHKLLSSEDIESWRLWFNEYRVNLRTRACPAELYVKY